MLDPWYVTGICEGEGTFTYSRSGPSLAPIFGVRLVAHDGALVDALHAFFGVGAIYRVRARRPSGRAGWTKAARYYRVSNRRGLPVVIAHFDRYPLQGEKRQSFDIWREMVECWLAHGPRSGRLHELAVVLSASRPCNQPWVDGLDVVVDDVVVPAPKQQELPVVGAECSTWNHSVNRR